ncbi:hypothetical protein Fot_27869 [Forsythia ovata]|uniref:Uncharacterized protein n=1 Tax=Forsythia ovata TaxID=205694 RepID=A0ABD1TMD9_9LAMI
MNRGSERLLSAIGACLPLTRLSEAFRRRHRSHMGQNRRYIRCYFLRKWDGRGDTHHWDRTDPTWDRTEGISDVTSCANGMEEGIPTIVFDVYKTVTPGTDTAKGTGDGGRISSTTPPRLILSLGTLEK